MKIGVIGMGYVGISNAILLAQDNEVVVYDIIEKKIDMLNQKKSPIDDEDVKFFLEERDLNLIATSDIKEAVVNSEYVIIATPTDYNVESNYFDTSSVETVAKQIHEISPYSTIVIKSTIPIGFTENLKVDLNKKNIIFSPEFLREGKALYDNLYPSRIVIGDSSKKAITFSELLIKGAKKNHIDIIYTGSREAEAIKLFANTYLAMRVAFFNELDTYAEVNNLSSKQIINGIGLDPRIGTHYNNPSFGYGGYCLPKDTKQLKSNFENVPNKLISAIVDSNEVRKNFISEQIIDKNPKIVGVFRLNMKAGSDNFRDSAVQGVIEKIYSANIEIIIYEPTLDGDYFDGYRVIESLEEFKELSDIIIANRLVEDLYEVQEKVYSRDIFYRD